MLWKSVFVMYVDAVFQKRDYHLFWLAVDAVSLHFTEACLDLPSGTEVQAVGRCE